MPFTLHVQHESETALCFIRTIGRRFVQERILTMGKGTTKTNLQQQIEYGVKVLFTNKMKMVSQ